MGQTLSYENSRRIHERNFKLNEANRNFRFFSPDETYSNKLEAIFEEESRAWLSHIKPWEKDLSKEEE